MMCLSNVTKQPPHPGSVNCTTCGTVATTWKGEPERMCADSPFTSPAEGNYDIEGISLVVALDTQGSPPSPGETESGGCGQKTESDPHSPAEVHFALPQRREQSCCCGSGGGAAMVTESLPSSLTLHRTVGTNAAVDISPSFFIALLSYTDEMNIMERSKLHQMQRDEEEKEREREGIDDDVHHSTFSKAMDFIRVRLGLSGDFPLFPKVGTDDHWKKGSETLSWFLQRHHEVSVTMMSMSFGFLLGLGHYRYSWKKAAEVPLTALQLLADYAHAMTFQANGNNFDTLTPRQHLLVMAASILASWKYADVDANVTVLLRILDATFFHHQRVLNIKDIVQVEAVVLGVCGLCVRAPRWWTVAIVLLSECYNEEKEAEAGWDLQVGGAYSSDRESESQYRYEVKLERLLLASERFILFLIDTKVGENDGADNHNGCTEAARRLCELRVALCGWMESHPLFGVAVAASCGAVQMDWAASYIGPTGGIPGGWRCAYPVDDIRGAICSADEAAQRELYSMTAVLTEILRYFSEMEMCNE